MPATLDGAPVPHDAAVSVRAGQVLAHRRDRRARASAPISRVAGGFDAPDILGSRATFALGALRRPCRPARCGPAMCCTSHARPQAAAPARRAGQPRSPATGASASSTARMARRISSTEDDIATLFSAPLRGAFQLARTGRAPDRPGAAMGAARTAARRGCIRRTFTTTPMPSARSTSPATCRSSSAPMARASAASSARR